MESTRGLFAFPRSCRITRTSEYQRVYRTGRRFPAGSMTVFVLPAPGGVSRIGLAVGRKVGGAVVRNRVKRRLREILRKVRPGLERPTDLVVVASPRAAARSSAELEGELLRALRAQRLLS